MHWASCADWSAHDNILRRKKIIAGLSPSAIPKIFRPMIGAVVAGVIGLFFPEGLGLGYGFLQYLIDGDLTKITTNFFAVLDVSKGTNVTITICNTYSQREGF